MAKVKPPAAWEHTHYVAWLERNVAPGESVVVPDDDLASYVEVGWTVDKAAEPRNVKKEN